MKVGYSLFLIGVMSLVTYMVRMVPLTFFNKKINNRFLKSFLYYVTYAVLGAMTFPEIFFSTGFIWSGVAGAAVALIVAFCGRSLLTVAISACAAALITNTIIMFI